MMEKTAQPMHVDPAKNWKQMEHVAIAKNIREPRVRGEDVVQTHASHDKSSQWTAPAKTARRTQQSLLMAKIAKLTPATLGRGCWRMEVARHAMLIMKLTQMTTPNVHRKYVEIGPKSSKMLLV